MSCSSTPTGTPIARFYTPGLLRIINVFPRKGERNVDMETRSTSSSRCLRYSEENRTDSQKVGQRSDMDGGVRGERTGRNADVKISVEEALQADS
jgi:hypothetical protein